MWRYSQSTGELFDNTAKLLDTGYSGRGDAKNDPEKQCMVDSGPIPRGYYTILDATDDTELGPLAIPLSPDKGNDMCGRAGFYIHGDKASDPGNASQGCIVIGRAARRMIASSSDRRLQVVRASGLSVDLNAKVTTKAFLGKRLRTE